MSLPFAVSFAETYFLILASADCFVEVVLGRTRPQSVNFDAVVMQEARYGCCIPAGIPDRLGTNAPLAPEQFRFSFSSHDGRLPRLTYGR